MSKIEINGHTELYYSGKKCTYVIGTILNKNFKYVMPWLSFVEEHGMQNEKVIDTWDSEDYLKELYNEVIFPWVSEKKINNHKLFTEFLKEEFIELEDFEGLHNLFDKAYEMKLL